MRKQQSHAQMGEFDDLWRFSHEDTVNPGEDKNPPCPPYQGGNPADPERSGQDAILNS